MAAGKGKKSQSSEDAVEPHDADLYEDLRQWRLGVARRDNVAAFIVFYNRTLEEIARRRPRDQDALLRIPGVGPVKLAKYGQAVIEVVKSHSPR